MLCSRLIPILFFTAKRDVHWWASKLPATETSEFNTVPDVDKVHLIANLENIALKRLSVKGMITGINI